MADLRGRHVHGAAVPYLLAVACITSALGHANDNREVRITEDPDSGALSPNTAGL